MREREEALYVYHQEFQWEGKTHIRKGFMGRIRLERFGEGKVFPHEQTLSGPKADRLKLLEATRTKPVADFSGCTRMRTTPRWPPSNKR